MCAYLGRDTGKLVKCLTCASSKVKVFECAKHGECTILKPGEGVQARCSNCRDNTTTIKVQSTTSGFRPLAGPVAYGGPVIRNLIYHICPLSKHGGAAWKRNITELLKRISLFNGRRCVAILSGRGLDSTESVVRAFKNEVSDFIFLDNDPKLREVVSFEKLLSRVESNSPREVTFFGHTKGVTRPFDDTTTVHRWADLMYQTCLDYWPMVERLLLSNALVGSFKKIGNTFTGSKSKWHYSGTFFWMRNKGVFSRNWREIDRAPNQWWGAEAWPGLHFAPTEAACLFRSGNASQLDLYDYSFFHNSILPDFEEWKVNNLRERMVTYA